MVRANPIPLVPVPPNRWCYANKYPRAITAHSPRLIEIPITIPRIGPPRDGAPKRPAISATKIDRLNAYMSYLRDHMSHRALRGKTREKYKGRVDEP